MKQRLRAIAVTTAFGLMVLGGSAIASDHLDAPGLTPPGGNTQYDLTDLYAFQSPSDPDSVVLIQAVNPTAGIGGAPTDFATDAVYSFRTGLGAIGEASTAESVLDINAVFTGSGDSQTMVLSTNDHTRWMPVIRTVGGVGENLGVAGGGNAMAGLFDDPFFFDLNAFLASGEEDASRGYCDGQEADFFAGLNVSAIIVEVPSAWWSSPDISVWATTSVSGTQIDRAGRPAISTVFVPAEAKDAYNAAHPSGDVESFAPAVAAFFGGEIPAGLEVLLPDVLTINTGSADGFLNGRHLTDDVIDIELGLITDGAVSGDCVDANDVSFPGAWPYLAPAHTG